jgi:nicotinamidase-related amidase
MLAGRFFRMYPPGAFKGFAEESLELPVAETAVLAVDIYGGDELPDAWSGMVSEQSGDPAVAILRDHVGPVLEAARTRGLPVVYAANSAPRIRLANSAYGRLKRRSIDVDQDELYVEEGVDPREYHAGTSDTLRYARAVAPQPGDYFIRKHVHSAFFDTRLDTLLRNLGVRNLICLGFALDVCLGTTMIDAVWRNYNVVLLRDATYAIEIEGIDAPGEWTKRWVTYVECNVGHSATSADFIRACAR